MKAPSMTIIERARRYVSKMPEAISGQHGHSTMFSVACVLVQGFSLDMADARMLLAEYNATLCEPFSGKQVDHKLQDAAKAQSTRGQGYLLNASDRTANIRVTLKKPANTPPQTVQRVGLGTLGTGISCMDMKNIIILLGFASILLSYQIPTNNLNNTTLNRWIVVKEDNLEKSRLDEYISDPKKYIND